MADSPARRRAGTEGTNIIEGTDIMATPGQAAGDPEHGTPPRKLTPAEEAPWRALARLIVTLPRALSADLQQGAGMTLSEYSVLLHLSEAPQQQLRMSDLAHLVAVSPAQTSRLIDTMTVGGDVSRIASPDDARSTLAVLTPAGLARLQAAWPVHLASTRALVTEHWDAEELPVLDAALNRVAAASELALRNTRRR